jgi:WXG100 family type VII secretion target
MAQGTFDSAEIANHANLTRQRSDELEQAIGALRSAAGQLSAVWTGPGAAAFQTTREQWERAVHPLLESLQQMGVVLNQASSAYETNESSIARAFGG